MRALDARAVRDSRYSVAHPSRTRGDPHQSTPVCVDVRKMRHPLHPTGWAGEARMLEAWRGHPESHYRPCRLPCGEPPRHITGCRGLKRQRGECGAQAERRVPERALASTVEQHAGRGWRGLRRVAHPGPSGAARVRGRRGRVASPMAPFHG